MCMRIAMHSQLESIVDFGQLLQRQLFVNNVNA